MNTDTAEGLEVVFDRALQEITKNTVNRGGFSQVG
jgi:hypothetical protein